MESAFLPNAKNKTSFTHNAIRTSWAADGVINFYTKRNLQTVDKITKQKYLKVKDTELGYLCIDDTLYIMAYMY